ncbi:hypothetical protein LEM8419_02422 [Neolewinella maritima]|uniref:Lipoprotein n=1 Tax=Neolewinella maritima TaxID=1383882 RepID=A0ABN8F4H4_9BACT|nr:hypothetical protein [Neolewinella maritima]CAH1001519.1 hypothetical protein LEM8419_02422 [Neolewinella maritima]
MTYRLPSLLLLLLCFPLLTGCYADELQQDMEREPFFDLAGYIDAQVDSLTALDPTVRKTIVLNGVEESKELDDLRFATDLRLFREADINKPAWLDKYTLAEEEAQGGGAQVRVYTATDSSMQTRQLEVTLIDDRPTKIVVLRKTGTVLSDGTHRLTYDPALGYDIRTEQVNRFGDDLDATITVRWK